MSQGKKFGAFGGVFTPSILTILGVIMYMRLGMVVGNAGTLFTTIAIILLAHIVSVTTGLSVSSVATDKKIIRFLKAKLTATNDGKLELQVLKGQESFRIKSFIGSNVWALFKGGQSKFKKGELIDCYSPVGSNINIFK